MTSNTALSVGLVAGEASGDLLGGLLLQGLRAHWPLLTAQGVGGRHMQAQGLDTWASSDELAVRGYVEVLRKYRSLVKLRDGLGERWLRERPDLFVGIDAPDFNLGLEERLKQGGIKTVHFICPSIWAWRPERVEVIRRSADHVLCLFPFEPALLHEAGIGATYVGHPLASVIPMEPDRAQARRALGLPEDAEVVALLPGSRRAEIAYLAERMFTAARRMQTQRPGLRFVVPAMPALRAQIEAAAAQAGLTAGLHLLDGQSHAALAACDVTLIASGTATLEAALFKRPMVIVYNMHWLSWKIHQRKRRQPWVGLPNILSGDFVVPELIQEAATPEAMARETLAWLEDPAKSQALHQRFADMHHALRRDTARLASDAIGQVLSA